MESKFESQVIKVENHLKTKGQITSWEAIQLYHATRLSAIIYILRHKKNLDIPDEWDYGIDKEGKKSRFKRYIYKGEIINES